MANTYKDATVEEIDKAMQGSWNAFTVYRKKNLKKRALFLHTIAGEMRKASTPLIELAHSETHLDKPRLEVELKRTIFQLTSYADACAEGTWLDIRIDTGD